MQNIKSKTCNICRVEKPITDFHKSKSQKFGVTSICKICACAKAKEWKLNNPDKVLINRKKPTEVLKNRERAKEWAKNNPEKYKERQDKYRIENADALKAKKSNYQKENWDARKNYHKKWCNKNQKHVRTYCKTQLARSRKNLDDWYIRSMLSQNSTLKSSDIPQGLVEAKKEQIKIKRLINELSN